MVVQVLVGYGPAEQTEDDDREDGPRQLGHGRAPHESQVQKPPPEEVRHRRHERGQQRAQGARPHGEVLGQIDAQVRAVPGASDQDRDQQEDALRLEQSPELAQLAQEVLPSGRVADAGAVCPDDFLWRGEEQGQWQAETLQGDQDQIRGVSDLAGVFVVDVQRELDRGADDLAQFAESEPDAGC